MLAIRLAASEPPAECIEKLFLSSLSLVHFRGTVHSMLSCSHLIASPPASAVVWAAVGCAFSTTTDPLPEDEDLLPAFEFFENFNLSVRLQSERARPSMMSTGICFIFFKLA